MESDDVNDLIASLFPEPMEGERRQHSLTRDDLILIAKLMDIKIRQVACPLQLSMDDEKTLKSWLKTYNKGVGIFSTLILLAIGGGILAIFSKGFWATLFEFFKGQGK